MLLCFQRARALSFMYLGDCWYTIDNEPIYEIFAPKTVSEDILRKYSDKVWKRRFGWSSDIRWKYIWVGKCSIRAIVSTNTDETLNKKNKDWDHQCKTCRGKGHSWKAQIWNGRPYLVKDSKEIKDWSNPDWCKDCRGHGSVI